MRVAGTMRVLVPIALAALFAAGCGSRSSVRLWADAASPTGEMSLAKHQWAYDGEPVQFVLDCPAGVNYAAFDINGRDAEVKEEDRDVGKYPWTHTFTAGDKPVEYEVHAAAFVIRGRRDWYFDTRENKWYYHPGAAGDKTDVLIGEEQTMRITCYRREVRVFFDGRGGAPQAVELTLGKATGEKVTVPRRRPNAPPDARGFLVLGPDAKGAYEVTYTPTYKEVSRAGKTDVEVLVTHGDGSQERVRQSLDTP